MDVEICNDMVQALSNLIYLYDLQLAEDIACTLNSSAKAEETGMHFAP